MCWNDAKYILRVSKHLFAENGKTQFSGMVFLLLRLTNLPAFNSFDYEEQT